MGQYDEMTQEELEGELKNRDLPYSGTKDEQVARLQEDDDTDGGDTDPDAAPDTDPDAAPDEDDPRPSVATSPSEGDAVPEDADNYVGVDPIYQNAASHHVAPLKAEGDDEDDIARAVRENDERNARPAGATDDTPTVEERYEARAATPDTDDEE